jgi:prepilin-type N-terminal cleavage/methylation domain-containing protein
MTPKATNSARGARRRGFSFVELVVAIAILTVALGSLASAVVATSSLNRANREVQLAAAAAQSAIERIRAARFEDAFALFNDDPADDPVSAPGEPAAPGSSFEVPGLAGPGVMAGRIVFPTVDGELREDVELAKLGLPRDLSGDREVDSDDHAHDYQILPVQVRITWSGTAGMRTLDVYTLVWRDRAELSTVGGAGVSGGPDVTPPPPPDDEDDDEDDDD